MSEALRLRRRLFLSQSIILFLLCAIVVASVTIPLYKHLVSEVGKSFTAEVENKAAAVSQWVLRAIDLSRQITSRTRIRQELQRYNQGLITKKELVDFTRPKLQDAMRISSEIVGITRFDATGTEVVRLGATPPPTDVERASSNLKKVLLGTPFLYQESPHIWLRAPITDRTDNLVGSDVVVIKTTELQQIVRCDALKNEPVNTHYLLAYPKNGELMQIVPGAQCDPHHPELMRDILRTAQPAIIGTTSTHFHFNALFCVASQIEHSNWVLVTYLNEEKLYAPINRDLRKFLSIAFGLYCFCLIGYWKLLHPLTKYLLIKHEELEKEITNKTTSLQNELGARVEAERALRESEARLSHIIMGSPVPTFVVDNHHITTHWNKALETVSGIPGDEVIGTANQWKAFYAEKRPVMADLIVDKVPESAISKYYEGKYKISHNIENAFEAEDFFPDMGKNGRWLFFTAAPLRNSAGDTIGAVETLQDTTARKKAERALKESEERHRLLIEYASDAIFIAQDEIIKFPNPKTLELTGYSENELSKMPFTDLVHREDRNRILERYNRLLNADKLSGTYSFKIVNKKGKSLDVQISATPIIWEGKPATLNLVRDITEFKKFEEKLRQAQKMEAIGTLAGGIAHDFNNILAGIFGYAQLLQLKIPQDSKLQSYVEALITAGNRAKSLVSQILTFSRQSSDERRPIELQPIIKESLKLLQSTIPSTIEIRQNIRSDCGLVFASPIHIHQITMNLCTNAYHAMEKTGGVLSVSLCEVKQQPLNNSEQNSSGRYALLTVKDTGTGIDPHVLPLVFDPYFTTKGEGKGTGMGLAVINGIVNEYGGNISVKSELESGTEFKILLPIIEAHTETDDTISPMVFQKGKEHILLIDDQKDVLDIERQMLESLGYTVTAMTSSADAIEKFSLNSNNFDMVITDMTMPNMTGYQLSKEFLKMDPSIPIIMCTGFSEGISKKKAIALGIKGFLMKPLVLKDLSELIRKVIDS